MKVEEIKEQVDLEAVDHIAEKLMGLVFRGTGIEDLAEYPKRGAKF